MHPTNNAPKKKAPKAVPKTSTPHPKPPAKLPATKTSTPAASAPPKPPVIAPTKEQVLRGTSQKLREELCAARTRPKNDRTAPPYTLKELEGFDGLRLAEPQDEEHACPYFKEQGACPWEGTCRDCHVAYVVDWRADGAGGVQEFLRPFAFPKHAKVNSTLTKAKLIEWKNLIINERRKKAARYGAQQDAKRNKAKRIDTEKAEAAEAALKAVQSFGWLRSSSAAPIPRSSKKTRLH